MSAFEAEYEKLERALSCSRSHTRVLLGSPVVPFYPFSFWAPLLKPNRRKKGALIIKGLLGNLVVEEYKVTMEVYSL